VSRVGVRVGERGNDEVPGEVGVGEEGESAVGREEDRLDCGDVADALPRECQRMQG